jgi:crotonobetainyl-CoA:carnitine CoA-transferase CaiB-like acyl-CoA transferase
VRPLQGVRILDLTWLLAGAGGPRLLASLGAEVIRLEWRDKLDFLRHSPPVIPVEGETQVRTQTQSVNRGGLFNDNNPGKRSFSLNMAHPKGKELFKRLLGLSDVIVESYRADAMTKWGLGYDVLRSIKPDIIYMQQSGWGHKGPYYKYASYGPIAQAISGLTDQSGLPDPHPPAGWGYSYMDWSGAYYCAIAMILAIYYKKRTGKGQYIDGSQIEPGIFMTGTAILDHLVNDRHWKRTGNRSPYRPAAPHGAYRCAGTDRWIAIAVSNDDQWRALAAEMGNPAWSRDAGFSSLAARIVNQDELDRLVGEWTRDKEPFALQDRLQKAGVPAGVCQTSEDRVERDPQLKHLKWLIPLPNSEVGTWPIKDVPFHFANATVDQGGPLHRASPCYGEDNDYVYGELLKLPAQERADLEKEGVI